MIIFQKCFKKIKLQLNRHKKRQYNHLRNEPYITIGGYTVFT